MKPILIKSGRIIDPSQNFDEVADLLLAGGKVARIGSDLQEPSAQTIEASGLIVTPGLVDMHVHLREPGKEHEETIASGALSAVTGGFTSVACMPNTEPVVDNEASANFVFMQAERAALANVYPIGAITVNQEGKRLSEMGQLTRGGAVAFSDDGQSVADASLLRRALEYAFMLDKPIIEHCEDRSLSAEGVMHEGRVSMVLGLAGIPAASETVAVARDLILAELTGAHLHIAHVSTRGSCELVRLAKSRGVRVTAEATPHHFSLTHESVRGYDPTFKMNPPLRTLEDVSAVRQALADGTIDVIASDHAPHAPEEKAVEFVYAPFGVIGMESVLPVILTELVAKGVLSLKEAIAKLTMHPARILRIPKGTLRPGSDADVTVIDPKAKWKIDAASFRSKSRNCPFDGWEVTGRAVWTIVRGEVKYSLRD